MSNEQAYFADARAALIAEIEEEVKLDQGFGFDPAVFGEVFLGQNNFDRAGQSATGLDEKSRAPGYPDL